MPDVKQFLTLALLGAWVGFYFPILWMNLEVNMFKFIRRYLSTIPFIGNVVSITYTTKGAVPKEVQGFYLRVRYNMENPVFTLIISPSELETLINRYVKYVSAGQEEKKAPKGQVVVTKMYTAAKLKNAKTGKPLVVASCNTCFNGEKGVLTFTRSDWERCRKRSDECRLSAKFQVTWFKRFLYNLAVLFWKEVEI